MDTRQRIGSIAVIGALLGGGGFRDEAPRFGPEADTTLTKTYRQETAWFLEDLQMEMGGNPVDQELPEVSGEVGVRLAVTDEYLALEGARLDSLRRTFDEGEARSEMRADLGDGEALSFPIEYESGFVDRRVLFTRDEDADELIAAWDEEEEGDPELLEGLDPDLDFAGFLPATEVELDEEWEVELPLLAALLRPGGDLALRPEEWEEGSLFTIPTITILAASLASPLESATGEIEGSATATWRGIREEEERTLAEIEVELDVVVACDKTERFRECAARMVGDEYLDTLHLSDETDLTGTGRILWDVEASRIHGFEFELELVTVVEVEWADGSVLFDDEPMIFAATYEASGTVTLSLACEE